jgi:hypothetical protein
VTTPLRLALLLLCAASLAAQAPQPATVAQLQQTLARSHAENQSDWEAAAQLSALQLTQRLAPAQLAALLTALPGEQSRFALTTLADRSVFFPAPPSPSLPPTPDPAEQRRVMALAVDYVAHALHKLPNFFATRTTAQLADWPSGYLVNDTISIRNLPLQLVYTLHDTVTYRDGHEVVEPPPLVTSRRKRHSYPDGFTARGIFGPILSIVIVDAAHGTSAWDRWETSDAGSNAPPVAVFRYTVPMDKSTYNVSFCCVPRSDTLIPIDRATAYHGEIAVDPATGTILRITALADLDQGNLATLLDEAAEGTPLVQADLAVEYGPVEMGGASYICPTRSIALSRALTFAETKSGREHTLTRGPVRTYLNDTTFTNYHVFRSDSRILLDTTQP